MRHNIFSAILFGLFMIPPAIFAQGNNNNKAKPAIIGQKPSPMTAFQGSSVVIQLENLIVRDEDPEPVYPNGFTLDINPGQNYGVNGNTVIPDRNFAGLLHVKVRVDDGERKSDWYDFEIDILKTQNEPPRITGQSPLSVAQGESLTITLDHLRVTDPENNYPNGFTLKVFEGKNYAVNGNIVTPTGNFSGNLKVPVSVSDGQIESNKFELTVDVIKKADVSPQITGQVPLSVHPGESLTIELSHLLVKDPDNAYPTGYTLKVFDGNHYTVNGNTISPDANFVGALTVAVSVNDGKNESNRFELKVEVIKMQTAPLITGQLPLSINPGESLTIELDHLTVVDADDNYPTGFSLKIFAGPNYTITVNSITPASGFSGTLHVPVTVNDGKHESNRFDLKVTVKKITNALPQITGQKPLQIIEDKSITLQLSDVTVVDPDNNSPNSLALKIKSGNNYSVAGNTITPAANFFGMLTVPIQVNDGISDSEVFNLKITVTPVNDPPVITGQSPLSINKNTVLQIQISNLIIVDPDNSAKDFKLQILNGNNYSAVTNVISPTPGFTGLLEVGVLVSDGTSSSSPFGVKINVISPEPNEVPVIATQKKISISQNVSITLQLSDLVVNDSDDEYPQGFILQVLQGENYSVSGTTVTPRPDYIGLITVPVKVNDGKNDSAPFNLKITVLPRASKPIINGQRELIVPEDSTITIGFSDLLVSDADQPNYPKGFTLVVLPGKTYTKEGNAVTPLRNLTGYIEVGVVVSDGKDFSDEYKLSILVQPVNDPPEIVNFDTTRLAYEPGKSALAVFRKFRIRDTDNSEFLMAEVGFKPENYVPSRDRLIINSDSSKIRRVYDDNGTLYLIGYASAAEYQAALQNIQYEYKVATDEYGNPGEILSGPRTVYLNIFDGKNRSVSYERKIYMEIDVELDIPTAFTPNGDNRNDTWQLRPTNTDKVDDAIIRVYNRHGLLVFEAKGFSKKWDGLQDGKALPVDTYYYTIDLNLPYTRKTYTGTVSLLH